jgi:serine/threonine protein phosphatase PrpC
MPCPAWVAALSDIRPVTIGEPGRTATTIGPCAPTYYPDSTDHELSECAVPGAEIRAASIRGLMHRFKREPRQDRFSVVYDDATATLVIVVCDGVGEFALSQEAAAFVALDAPRAYLMHRDWHAAVAEVNRRLVDVAEGAAHRTRLLAPSDHGMATTLAAVAIRFEETRRTASIAWVGDTSVWLLAKGGWESLNDDGPAADRDAPDSGRVRALPNADARPTVIERELTDGAVFVTTDGVGNPLRDAKQVREALADWWAAPPDVFTFGRQVGFARKSHLDDRTAVGVWLAQR